MKKFRKLLPALSMLLISALLMGSSTFAWFSMNTTVTATGMQVEATAPKSLSISNAADGTFTNSVSSATSTKSTLIPVSTADLTNWFYVKDAGGIDYNNSEYTPDTTFSKVNAETSYFAKHSFWLKVTGGSETDNSYTKLFVKAIEVKAGAADATANLPKALRVGVVCGEKKYIYAPKNSSVEYKAIASLKNTDKPELTNENVSLGTHTSASTLVDKIDGTAKQVDVYIWFEGQDTNCKSSEAINIEAYTITLTFEVSAN